MHPIPPDLGKTSRTYPSHLPMHHLPLPSSFLLFSSLLPLRLPSSFYFFSSSYFFSDLFFLTSHSTWKEYFLNTTVVWIQTRLCRRKDEQSTRDTAQGRGRGRVTGLVLSTWRLKCQQAIHGGRWCWLGIFIRSSAKRKFVECPLYYRHCVWCWERSKKIKPSPFLQGLQENKQLHSSVRGAEKVWAGAEEGKGQCPMWGRRSSWPLGFINQTSQDGVQRH